MPEISHIQIQTCLQYDQSINRF